MHRRMYLRTLVAGGIVGAGVGTDALGDNVVQPVQAQSDSEWSQQAKLTPDDGDDGDWFGMTAVDGTTAMVGSPRDDSSGTDAGSVYAFERVDGDWTQRAKLTAGDGEDDDRFGFSVAVDGTTAVVGARFDDNDNGDTAGAAYIFENDDGWSETTKLTPNDGDRTDLFGRWVGIDGSTVVVGAIIDEDPNGPIAGSAYVFERSNGEWNQTAKLSADDGDEGDQFGASVAVDGSTVVVGADDDEDPNGEEAGSAYVFERSNGEWSQTAKLSADDGEPDDGFGLAVGVDKSRILVGAPGNQVNGTRTGSVYVFSTDGETWTKQTKLVPTDGDGGGRFGISLDTAEGTALVGADQNDNEHGEDAGATYVYSVNTDNEGWTQRTKLLPEDGDNDDRFGYKVSYDGTKAVVGARKGEDPNGANTGAAYVFISGDGGDGSDGSDGGDGSDGSDGDNPFPNGVPGVGSDPPTDPDGDGLYEDVNGDGTADFDDAVALAFAQTDTLTQDQIDALDFDGDGDVDFIDAVELAFSI